MINLPHLRRLLVVSAALFVVTACSSTDEQPTFEEKPVEELYNEAATELETRRFEAAAGLFDEVERQHPYSNWATQAQIMAAYSYYKAQEYDQAVATIDRFIRLHPGHKDVAYAYYLKGISFYEQISGVERDQGMTELAQDALREVILRFPNSKYAQDAQLKLDLTNDHLAGKEMAIGRYYQTRGNHLAAINRFQRVVDKFDTTSHIQEALHRLTESNLALGLISEAEKNASVLGHNYPGSEWYQRSFALLREEGAAPVRAEDEDRSFWDKTIGGAVDSVF